MATNPQNTPPPAFMVQLWWPGRDPEKAFDFLFAATMAKDPEWQVQWPDDATFRPPRNGMTWEQLLDYILEQDYQVSKTYDIVTSRRRGRWQGLYRFTISPQAKEKPV